MENQNRKIYLGLAVLLVLVMVSAVISQSVSGQMSLQDKQRVAAIEKAEKVPNVSMITYNSDPAGQVPLLISSAEGKVIDGAEYERLTGAKAEASNYITLPNLKLINNSNLTVTRIAVYMKSKLNDEIHSLRFHSVNIAPGAEFQVTAKDWAGPRGKMQAKFVQKDGTFVPANRSLDLASESMWMLGGVQDYVVGVMSAEFEGGTKWVTTRQ